MLYSQIVVFIYSLAPCYLEIEKKIKISLSSILLTNVPWLTEVSYIELFFSLNIHRTEAFLIKELAACSMVLVRRIFS